MGQEMYVKRALKLKPKEARDLDLIRSLGRRMDQEETQDTRSLRDAEEGEEFSRVFS
jgi:hypothetical protein